MRDNVISNRKIQSRRLMRDLMGKNLEPISLPPVKKHALDYPLLITVVMLCAFGILMLFSASYYYAQSHFNDGLYYVRNQLIYLVVGLMLMMGISYIPYDFYAKRWVYSSMYLALIILLVLVLLIGKNLQGAQRWIAIGPITVQPSEFTKFILVITLSNFMTRHRDTMPKFWGGFMRIAWRAALPCILILLQPNLSMVIIIVINFFIMAYAGGCDRKQLALILLAGFIGMIGYLFLKGGYQLQRFTMTWRSWDEIQNYAGNETYQVVQSLYAFANGGLFGQGFDASRQKLLFLPYLESDYILPIIAEELGYFAVLLLLAAYFFVLSRGLRIARNCKERFGSMLAVGMTCTLGVQVIINVAVVSGMLPATGQTLPFISSGGTSLISFLASMGVLLNVSRYTEKNKVKRG